MLTSQNGLRNILSYFSMLARVYIKLTLFISLIFGRIHPGSQLELKVFFYFFVGRYWTIYLTYLVCIARVFEQFVHLKL